MDVNLEPIGSVKTIESMFTILDFEDTIKLIQEIPELEDFALKKYNKLVHKLSWAVYHNKLHVVQWICSHNLETPTKFHVESASKRGHIDILIWLLTYTNCICTQRVMDIASCNGQFKVVKWILKNTDIKPTYDTIDITRKQGFSTLADWLVEYTEDFNIINDYDNNSFDIYNFIKNKLTSLYNY